jgi:hypothetical protein
MTTAPAAADEPKTAEQKAKSETMYVVLRERQGETKDSFEFVGNYAGTAEQAIRQAAASGDGPNFKEGRYFAIPARSFKAVTLTTSTETKVKLS